MKKFLLISAISFFALYSFCAGTKKFGKMKDSDWVVINAWQAMSHRITPDSEWANTHFASTQFSGAVERVQREVDVPVKSVNGKIGDVILDSGDVGTYDKSEIDEKIASSTNQLIKSGGVQKLYGDTTNYWQDAYGVVRERYFTVTTNRYDTYFMSNGWNNVIWLFLRSPNEEKWESLGNYADFGAKGLVYYDEEGDRGRPNNWVLIDTSVDLVAGWATDPEDSDVINFTTYGKFTRMVNYLYQTNWHERVVRNVVYDTTIAEHEQDPTVPAWAKSANPPEGMTDNALVLTNGSVMTKSGTAVGASNVGAYTKQESNTNATAKAGAAIAAAGCVRTNDGGFVQGDLKVGNESIGFVFSDTGIQSTDFRTMLSQGYLYVQNNGNAEIKKDGYDVVYGISVNGGDPQHGDVSITVPPVYTPSATDPTFSNAVLAVGLSIDTNSVAVLNEIAATFGDFPITGTATTVGGLLVALAAAVALLRKKTALLESDGKASNDFATDLLGKQVANPTIQNSAFEIADKDGHVALQIDNLGNLRTKNFNSSNIPASAGVVSIGGASGVIGLSQGCEVDEGTVYNLGRKGLVNSIIYSGFRLSSHRGSSDLTNNTIAAFEKARTTGFKFVEGDLRWTSDDILVFYHDETTPAGRPVSSYTLSELVSNYPFVPTLSQVLSWAKLNDVCLELDCASKFNKQKIVMVYDEIKDANMLCNCMITATKDELKYLAEENRTDVSACVSMSFDGLLPTEHNIESLPKYLKRFNYTMLSIPLSQISDTNPAKLCHHYGYGCRVWTATSSTSAQTCFNNGADIVIVDASEYWQIEL